MAKPIGGTLVETYLNLRGIGKLRDTSMLRFHPSCYWKPEGDAPTEIWPAMIAAVNDLDGRITGVHRTWLSRDGRSKAPLDPPRKAMGHLLGHAVRFGAVRDILAAGEGIETVLSLRQILPDLPMNASDDITSEPISSPTDHIVQQLQLYGYHPVAGEVDPRDPPEEHSIEGAVTDIFDALVATMSDTSLDPDLPEVLWSMVNIFHRALDRLERKLDDNEQAQKRLQREQDGSEVKSVQLETLIAMGQGLLDRRNSLEHFRETAADHFASFTGTPWTPRTGSRVDHRHLTAAMIDSRDFIATKRRFEHETLLPPGVKIAFSGGDSSEHRLIWDRLDQVLAKHPDMVLLHGGSPKGAEKIAALWASQRKSASGYLQA